MACNFWFKRLSHRWLRCFVSPLPSTRVLANRPPLWRYLGDEGRGRCRQGSAETSPCILHPATASRFWRACVIALTVTPGVLTMQEQVRLRDLPGVGILLASPLTTGFDERVGALVPAWRGQAIALKPFVAIMSNRSTRTVVAYGIAFETTDEGGRSRQTLVHFNYPNAVAGTAPDQTGLPRGREVRPGEERVLVFALRLILVSTTHGSMSSRDSRAILRKGCVHSPSKSMPQSSTTVSWSVATHRDYSRRSRRTCRLPKVCINQSCDSSTQVRRSTPSSLRSARQCGRIENRASTIQTIVRRCTPFRRPAMLFRRGRVLETTK